MKIVYERCAGLDVHKKNVVVCVITPDEKGQRHKQHQTFLTLLPDLLKMCEWLKTLGVTTIAMESTGSFWKPIFNVLEGHLEVLVVNAQHLKTVPGRKTDMKDAEWIADLLQHGLLRPSFVPPARASRSARSHSLSNPAYPRAIPNYLPLAEDLGGHQRQIELCGQRFDGSLSP
jgi:transposase